MSDPDANQSRRRRRLGWPAAPPSRQSSIPGQHQPAAPVSYRERSRRDLVTETWLVMIAMLVPWFISAAVVLGHHLATGATLNPLPSYDSHNAAVNIVLGL